MDCSDYKHVCGPNSRNLEIINFNIDIPVFYTKKSLCNFLNTSYLLLIIKKIINKFSYKFFRYKFRLYDEKKTILCPHLSYKDINELVKHLDDKNYIYQEYMWNFTYFLPYKEIIKSHLNLNITLDSKNKIMLEKITKYNNSCMIHIRRGDFINISGYTLLDMDYYNKAMNIIKQKYHDVHFFVFGNDMEFIYKNFNNKDCSIVGINGEDRVSFDFVLMRAAKHCIPANSTLSMWIGFFCEGSVIYKGDIKPNISFLDKKCIIL